MTAILTNHLGWVATVAPIINSSASNDQVITIHQNQAKMSEISKFHPYSVLWAQLGDLYGSVGNPSRLAKTIICGAHNMTINKVLNVLTYFVRCGEIQRIKSTKILDKDEIEQMIENKDQRKNMTILNDIAISVETQDNQGKGLSRSRTCVKEISAGCLEEPVFPESGARYEFQTNASFVRQPIDFDHRLIERNGLKKRQNSTIKLMVTSPNNDRFEYETASEAIDFVLKKVEPTENCIENIHENRLPVVQTKENQRENKIRRSLWSIDTVTEGISIDKWKPFAVDESDNVQSKSSDLRRSHSLKTKSNTISSLRRSKTFREMKVNENGNAYHGPTQAFFNVSDLQFEHGKQNDTLNELVRGTSLNKEPRRTDDVLTLDTAESVVFVLGDNEVLSGLKTPLPLHNLSNEKNHNHSNDGSSSALARPHELCKLNTKSHTNQASSENYSNGVTANAGASTTATTAAVAAAAAVSTSAPAPKTKPNKQEKKKKHCTHKKHSGVKFNFEQYPQIVTNYMKNKNLDITSYDFLEKGLKLEQENTFNNGASSTSFLPMFAPEDPQEQDEQEEEEECECCANTFRILQTPSNATELEFSNDDAIYPVPLANVATKTLETVIESDGASNTSDSNPDSGRSSQLEAEPITEAPNNEIKNVNGNRKKGTSDNSKKTNSSNGKECLELITLPIPKTQIIHDDKSRFRVRPGYVPSLFVGITDHFIPDMVLQVNFSHYLYHCIDLIIQFEANKN